jgi:ribose 5-phosphate isomerase B
MKIAIGSTRAGLTLKKEVIAYLEKKGHVLADVGMKEGGKFMPYHVSAANVAKEVAAGSCEKGIAICGTGAGSSIVANKFKGVYAVHCTNSFEAKRASAVNNANVLVLAEWLTPAQHAIEIIDDWLATPFGHGFEPEWQRFLSTCVEDIQKLEEELFK